MILTTEKDAVRFPPAMELAVPIYLLRVEIDILSGRAQLAGVRRPHLPTRAGVMAV